MNAGPRPRCPAKTGRSGDHSFIEYQKYIEKTNTKNQHQYYMNRLTHKLQITITNWLYTLSFIEETKCNIMLNTYYIRLLTHLLKQFRYNRQLHLDTSHKDWLIEHGFTSAPTQYVYVAIMKSKHPQNNWIC